MDYKRIIDEFIVPFVGRFDVPFEYDLGVGELIALGCFDAVDASAELDKLACFVGASYCAIIREDVNLQIPEGLQLVRRSAHAFDRLQRFNTSERHDIQYILARWQDARGRILYRSGNHALARLAFNEALRLACLPEELKNVSPCWPDIASNMLRNDFEMGLQMGVADSKRSPALRRLTRAVRIAEEGVASASDEFVKCEFERGLLSALHNWVTINKSKGRWASDYKSRLADLFSGPCQRDVYRHAQYVNMLAQSADTVQEKRRHYEQLRDMKWQRGRFFAEQHLAYLNSDWNKLLTLCEEIDGDIRSGGGIDAVDIDRYDYTLTKAEECAPRNRGQMRLRKQSEAITKALSAVVSIATYRPRFEKKIRPRLRRMAREEYDDCKKTPETSKKAHERLDRLVDRLEEFAAKEVVEILRTNRNSATDGESAPAQVDRFVIAKPRLPPPNIADASERLVAVACRSGEEARLLELRASRLLAAEEQHWLDHPLTIRAPVASPSERARRHTLAIPGTLIIRYVFMGMKEDRQVIAFWWFGGRSGAVTLPKDAIKLAEELSTSDPRAAGDTFMNVGNDPMTRMPRANKARELWRTFLEPVMLEIPKHSRVHHVTIILDAGLYHVPLNFAWIPLGAPGFCNHDRPLALSCATSFSLNLNAHLVEGRSTLNHCQKGESDDLWILENDFVAPQLALGQRLQETVTNWGDLGRLQWSATKSDLRAAFESRPEFLMFACHGETDPENGPSLLLCDCDLLSMNIAYSVAMKGNKLLILGACDSATADSDSYGRFIGAFIAAGAGAVLANPCKALIANVCTGASHLLRFHAGKELNAPLPTLAERLVAAANYSYENLKLPDRPDEERMLMASSYQLWL